MRKPTKWVAGLGAIALAAGLSALPAIAGPVGTASGFEDDDGNLNVNSTFDWNSFSPVTWTGTSPSRQATKTVSGWQFKGLEDWQATTADSGFAGGTKQDDNCPSVITAKAPNKDDMKRIYLSSKTVSVSGSDHVILNLAWVRIPQNTTSASAHIGFEFNKGTTACASGGLVNRSLGDMLIVYDFEGSATDNPTLTLRRWVTSGACEIGSNSPPCWGPAVNLTALGFAEAKVNTTATALDTVAPSNETLGLNEFGEAGIDLTAAGVFSPNVCESFGKAYAVSRSSGNSGTAQMKDLVGPADFNLQNCGSVTIIKRTAPRDLDQNFSYTSTLAGSQISCTADATPAAFTLNDNGTGDTSSNTETCTNVPAGSYTVTEGADPAGFAFTDLSCTASGTGTSATPASGSATRTASITIAGGGAVTCVYTNTQQLGAIKITKTSSKTGNELAGATFSITDDADPPVAISGSPFTTDANGEICVDGLGFGDYLVTETAAPTGFVIDDSTARTVTVDNNADCEDETYVGEDESFTNTPVADIQVRFRDGGSGETALDEPLDCDNVTGTDSTTDTTGWDDTLTVTGIEVDAPVVTVVCTFKIDP